MNWEAIAAIGEMLGAVGVILTLGYLAHQIRQNTQQLAQNERTAIAAAVNVSTTSYRENRRYIYTSADVSEIMRKGMNDPQSLSENDRYRFRLVLSNLVDALWDIYSQTLKTGYSPETWEMLGVKVVERALSTKGGRWFWGNFGDDYGGDFRAEIDRILEASPGGPVM
ncbi:MAG: hypothetical protein R3192_02285 [Woeseiaceae bacterium]|nr:hypothetical protein [Woeseiaceae bacterium]